MNGPLSVAATMAQAALNAVNKPPEPEQSKPTGLWPYVGIGERYKGWKRPAVCQRVLPAEPRKPKPAYSLTIESGFPMAGYSLAIVTVKRGRREVGGVYATMAELLDLRYMSRGFKEIGVTVAETESKDRWLKTLRAAGVVLKGR